MSGVKGQGSGTRRTTEQHRRAGNPSKMAQSSLDAEVYELEPAQFKRGKAPEPPRPLGGNGRAVWDAAWSYAPWLTESDQQMLLYACEQEDELALYRSQWGQAMERRDDWNTVIAPIANRMDKLRKNLFAAYRELGMSPIGRSILGVAEAKITDRLSRLYGDQYSAPKGELKVITEVIDVNEA